MNTVFVDHAMIAVRSGNGGKGCESYEHKSPTKLIPNGGDGGDGGDVIIVADSNVSDLGAFHFARHFHAENGSHGSSNKKAGKRGRDLTVRVPCGTSVWNQTKRLLIRDLVRSGESVIVVRGGGGGRGNSAHREATMGEARMELSVELDFKLVADVFLLGLPNSGKSHILNALTGSHVKVQSYPFSTTTPQLGTIETGMFQRLTVCELPALVSGSHEGKGIGQAFLRHLARAQLIVYILDPLSQFAKTLSEQIDLLKKEVFCYNSAYKSIPALVVVNKMDQPGIRQMIQKEKLEKKVILVSAESHEGLDKLRYRIERKLSSKK